MSEIATTKLSSKGQVVIPEEIRRRLGLEPGAQFVVIGDRDIVVLKAIHPPDLRQFDELVGQARKAAKRAGLRRSDVEAVVQEVREGK